MLEQGDGARWGRAFTHVVRAGEAGHLAPLQRSAVLRVEHTGARRAGSETRTRARAQPHRCAAGGGGKQGATHLLLVPGATRFDMGILVPPMVARPMCVPIVHSKYAAARLPLR